MSTEKNRTHEMTDWEAHQFHHQEFTRALGMGAFGLLLYVFGVPITTDGRGFVPAITGVVFMVMADLLLLAYLRDNHARRVVDWLIRKLGNDSYPWEAHDIEVTYRNE